MFYREIAFLWLFLLDLAPMSRLAASLRLFKPDTAIGGTEQLCGANGRTSKATDRGDRQSTKNWND
jgi:hypothetical protein